MMRASQTVGLAFLFVPISTIAYATLPKELNGDATALFTTFRNVFGSLGISVSTALVSQPRADPAGPSLRNLTPPERTVQHHAAAISRR